MTQKIEFSSYQQLVLDELSKVLGVGVVKLALISLEHDEISNPFGLLATAFFLLIEKKSAALSAKRKAELDQKIQSAFGCPDQELIHVNEINGYVRRFKKSE